MQNHGFDVSCADKFNADIGAWNTSRCETMASMFHGAEAFNQDIGDWDTSNVTSFKSMFYNAKRFDQNLGRWNMERATNLRNMFYLVELSTPHYDALLIGWAKQNVHHNLEFHGGHSKYTLGGEAEAARTRLIQEKGWTIEDGGPDHWISYFTLGGTFGDTCPLCWDNMSLGYTTRCKHEFCMTCLYRWANLGGDTCPLCRSAL